MSLCAQIIRYGVASVRSAESGLGHVLGSWLSDQCGLVAVSDPVGLGGQAHGLQEAGI